MVARLGIESPKHSEPLWLRLLKQQKALGLTGLTPSFLVGASLPGGATLNEEAAYSGLAELLSSVRDETPNGFHVVVAKCNIHGQPITSLYRTEERKPLCDPVLNRSGKPSALYAEERYFHTKGRDLDSLVDGLLRLFQSPLINGEYSYRDKAYCTFSAKDIEFIASAQMNSKRGALERSRRDK